MAMMIDTNNLVSISEANKNFSKVARMVDENGSVVILKNNTPRYLLIEIEAAQRQVTADENDLDEISKQLIMQNREAYEELAK
jgi:antitoxin Phd